MLTRSFTRIVLVSAGAITVACAHGDTVAPPRLVPLSGTVTLVAPTAGARFAQNDTTIGCPAHPARGHGFRLAFDWADVPDADRYGLLLKKVGALYPAINQSVLQSELTITWCNAFVIDPNLDNWVWRVAAIADHAGAAAPDTLWSEERLYGFQPCRLPGGIPCSAPPDTAPSPE